MKTIHAIVLLIFSSTATFCSPCVAAEDEATKALKTLTIIADYASKICTAVASEGRTTTIELSGAAKAQLNELLSKLATMNVSGSGTFTDTKYVGVLQKDLAGLVQDTNKCRSSVSDKLIDRLLPKPVNPTELDKAAKQKFALAQKLCQDGSFDTVRSAFTELLAEFSDHKEISEANTRCEQLSETSVDFKILLKVKAAFVNNRPDQYFVSFRLDIDGEECARFSNLDTAMDETCSVVPGEKAVRFRSIRLYDSNRVQLSQGADCTTIVKFAPSKKMYGALFCFKAPYVKCQLMGVGEKFLNFGPQDCPTG
jgi:hypothetical protein